MRENLRKLASRLAVPGYVLVAWGAIGNISRAEYVVRKMDQFAQLPFARLSLIVAGFGWLAWLVARRPPAADVAAERLAKVRTLVLEAQIDFAGRKREVPRDLQEAAKQSLYLFSIQRFLAQGFRHHVLWDYQCFLEHERERWKEAKAEWDHNRATAEWLGRLAARLTENDLDPGFVLPHDYAQYRKADSWTPNRRPI